MQCLLMESYKKYPNLEGSGETNQANMNFFEAIFAFLTKESASIRIMFMPPGCPMGRQHRSV